MKKRLFIIIFSLLICSLLAFGFAACGDGNGDGFDGSDSSGIIDEECSHTYSDWTVKTAATCTEKGEEVRVCTKCGDEQTQEVAALGHSAADDWTNGENTHWHACRNAGCTAKLEEAEHSDFDHYCRYCGYKTSEHDYTLIEYRWIGNDCCEAVRTCVKCSADAEGHDEKAIATVTASVARNKTCELPELTDFTATFDVEWAQTQTNKDVETASALGHDVSKLVSDENKHWQVCIHEKCGFESDKTEHVFASGETVKCNVCDKSLEEALQTIIGDGSAESVDISLKFEENAGSDVFSAISDGLENAADGTVNLTISGVKTIPQAAFFNSKIKSLTFGKGVTAIEGMAIVRCSNLTKVTIPKDITNIGNGAVYDCSANIEVYFEGGLEDWLNISFGGPSFYGAKIYFNNELLENITIPSTVTKIGDYSFYKNTSLKSVTISSGVTSIGADAFYGCSKLESITVPASLTNIVSGYNGAFGGCEALKNVYYNGEVEDWLKINFGTQQSNPCYNGAALYFNGELVENLTIPAAIEDIGACAFLGCASIKSLTLSEGVKTIGMYAFEKCTSLESVTIASSVTSIGNSAFMFCYALENITIPAGVKTIENNAFQSCTSLARITLSEGLESIGGSAFSKTAISGIVVPDSVTKIGSSFVAYCSNLESVVIGSGVTDLSNSTGLFNNCSSLTSITFKAPLTKVHKFSINGSWITTANVTLTFAKGQKVLAQDETDTKIWVATDELLYGGTEFCGNTFKEIVAPNDAEINATDLQASDLQTQVADYISKSVTDFTITLASSAGSDMFSAMVNGFANAAAASINLTIKGAETIPESAFYKNEKLKSIVLGDGVNTISEKAFEEATGITGVTFSDSVNNINNRAFFYCTSLKNVTLGKNVKTIGDYAFSCTPIENITLPNGLTTIDESAFYKCESLKEIVIPDSVTSVGASAFFECSSIKSITFGSKVTRIEKYMFQSCAKLTSITFRGVIKNFYQLAFELALTENITLNFAKGQKELSLTSYYYTETENSLVGGTNVDFCGYTFKEIIVAE